MSNNERPDSDHSDATDRLVDAYDRLLNQTKEAIDEAQEAAPKLRELLDKARDNMVALGELTREEAHRISEYVERDIEDAARYLAETGEDLREWWRFDLELMERRMFDAFAGVADQTRLEWQRWGERWAEQARAATLYQAGEITGPGSLVCDKCGAETHFTRAGRIPPCAECGNTSFRRPGKDD
jgi:polyhydroxyalkanoate synthesis regulator phasin